MHRRLALALLLSALVSCSDSTGPKDPGTGVLSFRTDPASCSAGTVELFVDAVSQGSFIFTPPGSFRDFTVTAGSHTAGAREVGGSNLIFPSATVTVPKNGKYTHVLVCQ